MRPTAKRGDRQQIARILLSRSHGAGRCVQGPRGQPEPVLALPLGLNGSISQQFDGTAIGHIGCKSIHLRSEFQTLHDA